jgi:hypothetical protein
MIRVFFFVGVVQERRQKSLAINRLELAKIMLNPTFMKLVELRRLLVRKTNRGRPK